MAVDEVAELAECAVIATPTTSHAEVAAFLLERGCDVLVEKPVTATLAEAERLRTAAAKTRRLIQVGHVERYNPAIIAAAPLVQQPRYIQAERLGVFAGRSVDIDVLLDLMIHDLHLVISLIGLDVVDVRGIGVPVLTDRVDLANVRLELAGGVVANLTASRVSGERVRKFRVFGRDSYVSVDTKEQEVKGYRLVKESGTPRIEPIEIVVERQEPLRAELLAFLDCVRARREPLVGIADGTAALALAIRVGEAVRASMSTAANA